MSETFDPVAIAGSKASPAPARSDERDLAVSLAAVLITFGVIFVAELPDKTLVASLVLGSRFRPLHVWFGVAAAFLVHVSVAVAVGSVFSLLPHRVVNAVVFVLFLAGAVLVWREGNDEAEDPAGGADAPGVGDGGNGQAAAPATTGTDPAAQRAPRSFWKVFGTSFAVIFLAEMGDLTQISTANLAARFHSPLSVWLGALLALWTVAVIAIAGGRGLMRILPVKAITRIAASAFVVLAVLTLVELIRG